MHLMYNMADVERPGGHHQAMLSAIDTHSDSGLRRFLCDLAVYFETETIRRKNGCMEPAEFVLEFDTESLSMAELGELVLRQGQVAKELAEQGLLFAAALAMLIGAGLAREIQLRQITPADELN